MKTPKLAIAVLSALFIVMAAEPVLAKDDAPFLARVVKVRDGDTIEVVRENLDLVAVRLYGIDAPESGQPHGQKAARHLRRLIGKQLVTVEPVGRPDRYGRTVAIVRLIDQDVGREMIRAGYAWVYADYCKRKRPCNGYWAEVRRAIKDKHGLWRDVDAAPSWKWRKQ